MNKFGKTSLQRLSTCDVRLQRLMKESITNSPYDFGITWGFRSPKTQYELYRKGRELPGDIVTDCDGYNKISKHNYEPSEAVDIHIFNEHGKLTWDELYYKRVAHHILEVAKKLNIKITWGGTFKTIKDFPHYQLIK